MRNLTITICAIALSTTSPLNGAAVVYESFDFTPPDTALNGNPGGTGLTGNWSGSISTQTANLSYGSLVTSGSAVLPVNAWNSGSPFISIGSSSLNGLLNDGGELWMSFLYQYGSNAGGVRYAVGLADARFTSNGDLFDVSPEVEQGIGVADFTDGVSKGAIPTIWDDNDFDGNNINGNPTFGNPGLSSGSNGNFGFIGQNNTTQLFVLHAQWGADGSTNDVVTLYTPGTDLVLGSPVALYQAIVSQDSFDTLIFAVNRESGDVLDEIRIGASFADVVVVVPEPSSTALLGLSGLAFLWRRRR